MIAVADTAHSILRVFYSSVIASTLVAVMFSLTVLGTVRAAETRRTNRAAAAAYTTLAVLGALAFTGTVIYGLILLTQKS